MLCQAAIAALKTTNFLGSRLRFLPGASCHADQNDVPCPEAARGSSLRAVEIRDKFGTYGFDSWEDMSHLRRSVITPTQLHQTVFDLCR